MASISPGCEKALKKFVHDLQTGDPVLPVRARRVLTGLLNIGV
jgi:hypothetical protein